MMTFATTYIFDNTLEALIEELTHAYTDVERIEADLLDHEALMQYNEGVAAERQLLYRKGY